jgi:hypothetical protein
MYIGDLDAAVDLMTRAARLDPLCPTPFLRLLVRARYLRGQLDEAARLARCLDESYGPSIALAAAIAALRGEDFADLAARGRPTGAGWTPAKTAVLFRDAGRGKTWLRGFEAAGLT